MPWSEIVWILVLMTALVIFGEFWFHLVESLLERIKRLLLRGRTPPTWHTLPGEIPGEKETDDGD